MKMKRKITIILTVLTLATNVTGCGENTTTNTGENTTTNTGENTTTNTCIGVDAMIKIGSGLYYDSYTGNVYWWNGNLYTANCAVAPTPYYAPNGRQYKYNTETNELEEP